jgi:hypothetical protein
MGFVGAVAGTYLTTARLAAANCTWAKYCSGGCDNVVGGTSVPKPPPEDSTVPIEESSQPVVEPSSLVPLPSPVPPGTLTALETCIVAVEDSKEYACNSCVDPVSRC